MTLFTSAVGTSYYCKTESTLHVVWYVCIYYFQAGFGWRQKLHTYITSFVEVGALVNVKQDPLRVGVTFRFTSGREFRQPHLHLIVVIRDGVEYVELFV